MESAIVISTQLTKGLAMPHVYQHRRRPLLNLRLHKDRAMELYQSNLPSPQIEISFSRDIQDRQARADMVASSSPGTWTAFSSIS